MRVTIIPVDGVVLVDGEGYNKLDLTFMSPDIHALQWYGTSGEVERRDERGRIVANEEIVDLTPYQPAIAAWEQAKASAEAAASAVSDSTTPSVQEQNT